MMGRKAWDQSQLFYLFNLESRVPAGHLLRRISADAIDPGCVKTCWSA